MHGRPRVLTVPHLSWRPRTVDCDRHLIRFWTTALNQAAFTVSQIGCRAIEERRSPIAAGAVTSRAKPGAARGDRVFSVPLPRLESAPAFRLPGAAPFVCVRYSARLPTALVSWGDPRAANPVSALHRNARDECHGWASNHGDFAASRRHGRLILARMRGLPARPQDLP